MHSNGWFLVAFCQLLGLKMCGWRFGIAGGAMIVVSLLLHEVGHMVAAMFLGVQVKEFGLCMGGAYNRRASASRRLDEILISMAGPLTNLALVFLLRFVPVIGWQLAGANLVICVVNLLPLPYSDGIRILKALWGTGSSTSLVPALGEPSSVR
jgi:Zn-dependent protease